MCFHDRLLEFTFSDGDVIQCCIDCTTFDVKRIEILKRSRVLFVDADLVQYWDLILNNSGLRANRGEVDWLVFGFDSALQGAKLSEYDKGWPNHRSYSTIDDHDWAIRQKAFPHSLEMHKAKTNWCPGCRAYMNQNHEHGVL